LVPVKDGKLNLTGPGGDRRRTGTGARWAWRNGGDIR
jgi:hypothetical protein